MCFLFSLFISLRMFVSFLFLVEMIEFLIFFPINFFLCYFEDADNHSPFNDYPFSLFIYFKDRFKYYFRKRKRTCKWGEGRRERERTSSRRHVEHRTYHGTPPHDPGHDQSLKIKNQTLNGLSHSAPFFFFLMFYYAIFANIHETIEYIKPIDLN